MRRMYLWVISVFIIAFQAQGEFVAGVRVGCQNKVSEPIAGENRLIVDFGSGTTKFKLLEFDQQNNIWGVVDELSIPIPHQKCLEESIVEFNLSAECIADGIASVKYGLESMGVDCNEIRCIGVATAWARLTKNLDKYFKPIQNELKIKTIVLSQMQEGAVAFVASIPFLKEKYPGSDLSKVIVWDIGGGSFQQVAARNINLNDYSDVLAARNALHSNLGPWGSVNFAHSLYKHLGINNTSRLLVGDEIKLASEFAGSLFGDLNSTAIAKRIKNPEVEVYAIGEFMNKGFLPFNSIVGKFTLDWAYLLRAMFASIDPNKELQACDVMKTLSPNFDCGIMKMIETNLLLVIAIMESTGLKSFNFMPEVSVAGAMGHIEQLIESLYNDPREIE